MNEHEQWVAANPESRFIRVETHTVDSSFAAGCNLIRRLNKPGRAAMLECFAMAVREDAMTSQTRQHMAAWLEIIAARERG